MEYVRKIVTYDDAANGDISSILTDFGFVDQTGKGFAGRDLVSTYEKATATQIYWKNDTARQSCIKSINVDSRHAYSYRPFRYLNSTLNWQGHNNYNDSDTNAYSNSSFLAPCILGSPTIYNQLTLIPLLNGGFIWNNVHRETLTSPSSLILINDNYPNQDNDGNQTGIYHLTHRPLCTLIGIPPSSNSLDVQSKYIYIAGCFPQAQSWWGGNLRLLWDFLDRKIIVNVSATGNGFLTTEPNYENLLFDVDHASYTNLNKNICVLIKMPHDKGYLENVYLMSTAPSNFRSGGIFSFAGRTFINLYSNIVVELPND